MFIFILILIVGLAYANIPHIGDDYKHSNNYIPSEDALTICFVFLSLGIGSIFKEINKHTKVLYFKK